MNMSDKNKNGNKQETLASTTSQQTTNTTTTIGSDTITLNPNMQYGWVCPKCGRVLAPWVSECSCYKGCSTAASTTIPLSNVDKFSESIKINNINPNTDKDGDIK